MPQTGQDAGGAGWAGDGECTHRHVAVLSPDLKSCSPSQEDGDKPLSQSEPSGLGRVL